VVRILKGKKERYDKQELQEALSVSFFFGRRSVLLLGLYVKGVNNAVALLKLILMP
jgi:hypothetical protein